MSKTLIAVTGLIYLYCAVEQLYLGNKGTSVMFAGYALANIGIWTVSS